MASRLEQLNRVAVRIFNLNLFAARADLHLISERQTRLFQLSDARRQVLHLKDVGSGNSGHLFPEILARSALLNRCVPRRVPA
jgi:hypothetical protein